MNAELKALVKLALDLVATGKDVIQKKNFVQVILPALYTVATDIPAVVSNMGDIKAEIAALSGTETEADLIAYVAASVVGIVDDAHAKAILDAALKLVGDVVPDVLALVSAIQAPAVVAVSPSA